MKKTLNKLIRMLISPLTLGLVVTLIFFYLLTHYYSQKTQEKNNSNLAYQAINLLHEKSIDWRLLDRGPQFGSDQVAIIAVDDRSVEKEGRWPWPREKIGRIISSAIDGGAKLIAFDAVFSEEDQNSSLPVLSKLKNFMLQNSVNTPLLNNFLNREMVTAASDQKFSEVIQKYADHIVMGSFFAQDVTPNRNPWQDACDDLLFKRSPYAKYWAKEELPVIALDSEAEREKLPTAFKDRMNIYFDELESRQIFEWLSTHQAIHDAIYTALINFEIGLTNDQIPMILPKILN